MKHGTGYRRPLREWSSDWIETAGEARDSNHGLRRDRQPWAELVVLVFGEDVLLCPCGRRRVVLAFVTGREDPRAPGGVGQRLEGDSSRVACQLTACQRPSRFKNVPLLRK